MWHRPRIVTRRSYRAPHPTEAGTRHISGIAVTASGRILVGSAADAGDDGPSMWARPACGAGVTRSVRYR
ncbi:hypothetical protein Sxan_07160 [Streptomyces xanthophaeus]|uniref:Uncharacterized protein n=1 Tax=Streptomyces xanthophaeus TaxID=67385 RepID=A0A919GSK5_9ACTN|nr:hypothetical protein Sxan_07160 [Streptomyces xanthophaeus]